MQEITYSNGSADVMVQRGEQGEILDIYTYAKDVDYINIPGAWNWKEGRNSTFVHLTEKQVPFYTALENQDNGFYNLD